MNLVVEMAKIIPTILTSSEEEYHKRLLLAEHVSDLIQIDVIDGKFAKNLTVDINTIKKFPSSKMLEIQLMVVDPQSYVNELLLIDYVSRIIVPFEGVDDLPEIIYRVKSSHKQVGISLNPNTPLRAALTFLDNIDLLLLLAVEPGFSGQKFQEQVLEKIFEAKKMSVGLAIEVDGGINFENIPRIVEAGANFLAVNSALFGAPDFYVAYEKLERLASNPS